MTATIIDGKARAAALREDVAGEVATLKRDHDVTPGLAVVLVGEDPASKVYVANKAKQTVAAGMVSFEHKLTEETSEAALLELVAHLNADPDVDGILVQMPLPRHIDTDRVVEAIDPAKDVDGLHPMNAGKIVLGRPGLVPCTPRGCVILAKEAIGNLAGKHAVVVGRSILVGKPVSLLLQNENCTVSMAHSRTVDLPSLCRQADILVAAVGRQEMIRGDWVKPGACVIDVGINRIPAPEKGDGKTRLVGDVAFEEAVEVAGAITPVPGGVGPMTIACLLANTVTAARLRRGLPAVDL
ncbi:methylenetetrahydrofolate dehydrogenase (NADP+)/methenyltetrahydrofolate cyclohydrolase [Rhodobium orientis]|uniref:Bifunctional protein FolD n=1 Tax=Rhodobium orientis TaxID=34017 RepID=A0A327JTH8_9HYPH|nr:bifunctional methylenetetrahydrofolate dehydrogenase/methenyltetrahydrofolate cyclohydrolase FolD [Rhodobium orientis]MBB4304266.1 methylenetetrahydrofolate dehydrogenase (NADP+)/methenyltetrahydrofolate cyclohydrolase [Rhodobium orientis]MBK5948239.1 bifunctional methylenetetrahydrofolate dehydrogenase/methenyltetrahydrofolate cyclohydrolase [Rhodobium orientis]RAI28774.1 bifunctional methylenetetrahydrofolate dehydrogenase/methenyltetrahydrofolate cyclohydrolase [Rhodobium orientis]